MGKEQCFCCVSLPLSREGNFRLQSTRFDCSSFYDTIEPYLISSRTVASNDTTMNSEVDCKKKIS